VDRSLATSKARGASPGSKTGGTTALSTVGRGAEADVDRIIVAVAIGMALVFAAGVILGVIAMVSMASRRQDRLGTLTGQSPEDVAATRRPQADARG
jgi:hypothetical protein